MGSPIVFQTAPPQPASNARITCPAVFVGGPDASQNGFGDSIPQKFTRRSAILHLTETLLKPRMHTDEHGSKQNRHRRVRFAGRIRAMGFIRVHPCASVVSSLSRGPIGEPRYRREHS